MFQIEIPTQTGKDLLTAAGVAIVTAIIVQLFARPILKLKWGVDSASEIEDKKQRALYSLALNGSAFVVALILAFIAQSLFTGLSYESAFEGFLVAVFGTVGAIGLGEVVPNFVRVLKES